MNSYSITPSPSGDLFPQDIPEYGGVVERLAALNLDLLILLPNYYAVEYYVTNGSMATVINLLVTWLYFSLLGCSNRGATIGKMAMNLKVVTKEGNRVNFVQASGRSVGSLFSFFILLFGFLIMLWDDKKQTLHDLVCGTMVIKAGS